jgi:two-component system, LytTR family, response regulator
MRALIVDDEPLVRRGIVLRLARFQDVEVIAECGDGTSAINKILELSPDLVFLDVQLPGMDGFDVLRALPPENMPAVIFLTAYEQHAVRAFEVHALDYLLKPVNEDRFARAVQRARQFMNSDSRAALAERMLQMLGSGPDDGKYVSRFTVRNGLRIHVVSVDDTDWIGAAGDYAELHVRGRSHLLRETMNSLEQKLDPKNFLRIHRSRILRAACIVELRNMEDGTYLVKLTDGSEHRSGRTYAANLQTWLAAGQK